ncbi:MAG: aminotransferase class III-fold pyridoxal phosphate-dependent enzyme [Chthonomonadales bacterium]
MSIDIEHAETEIEEVVDLYANFVNPGLASLMKFAGFGDVELSASGCYLYTVGGKKFLDCVGGYGVFSLGHRNPVVVNAVKDQLELMPLSTRTFFNSRTAQLAAKLAEITPGGLQYTFFSNSGTEAVEAALKIARIATGKTDFISTFDAYHGKTFGALSATGRDVFRKPFEPLVPGFHHVKFGDADALAAAITEKTAAIILEPIQGEGGIIVPPDDYLARASQICKDFGILLIADEVQTGFGRTGKFFACEHSNVEPDILCLAKCLGGGVMPIGATIGTHDVWTKAFGNNPLIHTSTFGGNPLACAAGLAAIQVIQDEGLVEASEVRGAQFMNGLKTIQRDMPADLVEVRGKGLMIGLEFAVKDVAELTINGMSRRGVIAAYTLNNPCVIRIEPPLIITSDEIDFALNALRESITEAVDMLADL